MPNHLNVLLIFCVLGARCRYVAFALECVGICPCQRKSEQDIRCLSKSYCYSLYVIALTQGLSMGQKLAIWASLAD